jgi:hypothetical protein
MNSPETIELPFIQINDTNLQIISEKIIEISFYLEASLKYGTPYYLPINLKITPLIID